MAAAGIVIVRRVRQRGFQPLAERQVTVLIIAKVTKPALVLVPQDGGRRAR